MATFRLPDDSSRLDFQLMRETAVSLYFSRAVLAEHAEWLKQRGYAVHTFDCSAWAAEEDFHTAVSQKLAFPSYYGRNLDAFNDCLCAIDVPEEGGTALAFMSFDRLVALSAERSWHILDIIAKWSRYFLLTGKRLMALVQSDDEGVRWKPVGARPVLLNRPEEMRRGRERLEQARRTWRAPDGLEN